MAKSFAEAGNVERCAIYLRKARDEGYKEFNIQIRSFVCRRGNTTLPIKKQ